MRSEAYARRCTPQPRRAIDIIHSVQNKGAFEALPVAQRKQVQVHFVSEYHEVFDKLFGESSADETPSSAVASAVAKNNPIKNMSP